MKTKLFFVGLTFLLVSCNNSKQKESSEHPKKETKDYSGEYATEDYFKKESSLDWMALFVKNLNDSTISVRIRSRVDLKERPTCTTDFTAIRVNDSTYKSKIDSGAIVITFGSKQATISSEGKGQYLLNKTCSGGGTFGGKYLKSDKPIDRTHLDPVNFTSTINDVCGTSCFITTIINDSKETLNVTVVDKNGKKIETSQPIDGDVVKAEAGDLDMDGYPEVFIYMHPKSNTQEMTLIGFSSNKGKSLSQIYFPAKNEYPKYYQNFVEDNEFAIVESSLVERFPLFDKKGKELKPNGKYKQLQYKLVNGESGKKLIVTKETEF